MTRDPECIFCKIVAGEIPGEVVWEDEKHLAILDLFPLRKAQTVIFPKEHLPSSIFALPDDVFTELFSAAKVVAEILENRLGAERTMIVGEGLEINHVHLKLYPRFKKENGLVHAGPQADFKELADLGRMIRG